MYSGWGAPHIDGSGLLGRSFFASIGSTGITFTFATLPTAAALVWTDGAGTVSAEFFGPGMVSLGIISPAGAPDGLVTGQTAEDRFIGAQNAAGILAIHIANTGGGIEVDHVQYGAMPVAGGVVPEPGSLFMLAGGLVPVLRRRRG